MDGELAKNMNLFTMCSCAAQAVLQFFYPSRCRSCNVIITPEAFLCSSCLALVKPVVSLHIPVTKKHVLRIYAAGAYQEPLRGLVLKKISSDLLASKQLGKFMCQMIPFHVIPCDILVPIPLHWTRYAHRGYNQAKEIAKVIGRHVNAPVMNMLVRHKRTVFQSTLSGDDRQDNVKDVFKIGYFYNMRNAEQFKGKNIVLVDDLYTTGATVKSAARALLAYNPASITVVVACRAL